MSDKYASEKTSQSNKKIVPIIFLIFFFLLIAGIIIYVILQNKDDALNVTENTQVSANYEETHISEEPSSAYETVIPTEIPTESTVTIFEETTESVRVPGAENIDDSLYFSGEFTAYRAYDKIEDRRVSLKEVFGSSYSGGTFVFNSDGTFNDNLSISVAGYGAYSVVDELILLTYSNDKNSSASIISFDDHNLPYEIMINYSGYEVYFRR